jgi:hypothetical protein
MNGPDNRDQNATTETSRWRLRSCKNWWRFPTSRGPPNRRPNTGSDRMGLVRENTTYLLVGGSGGLTGHMT